jgi:hypothetical protein
LLVPVLMTFCAQVCPAPVCWGEALIAGLFLLAGTAAARARFSYPPELAMAWVAVLVRLAKLLLYGGFFLARTARAAVPVG